MIVAWLAISLALASDERPPDEEITVYGEAEVVRARKDLMREAFRSGYTGYVEKDGFVILRHEQTWKGEILLYDDGWIRMRRQQPRVEAVGAPWADEGSPLAAASCLLWPWRCVKIGGWTVSGKKFRAAEGRALLAVQDEAAQLGDRVADASVQHKVNALPDRLYALWEEGVPLEGEAGLPDPQARKEALLDYFESRTDTPWGDEVRDAVAAFIRAEVQSSPWPFSDEEVAAFNARRRCERPLDLRADGDGEVSGE